MRAVRRGDVSIDADGPLTEVYTQAAESQEETGAWPGRGEPRMPGKEQPGAMSAALLQVFGGRRAPGGTARFQAL